MRHGPLRLAFGALLLFIVVAWTVAGIAPTAVRPADAPASEFSAERAKAHIEAIAKVPHPVGSPAHDEVRAYILGVLTGMGLSPRVEETTSTLKVAGVVYAAHVANILATLPGSRGGPAILLAAHYDSVPESRGASDDGSGVATLLETARALTQGPPLEHDVMLLFSDAEEIAAAGALAFTTEELPSHPVAVALNFEARGTRGAVALYDTSTDNGALVSAIASAAPRVVSTSLLSTLARALPNDSDASIFKRAGIPTYAFAYVDHLYQYHAYTDAIEALDLRSLQHDGDYALPLVRYFGHHDLPLPASSQVVYFDVLGRAVVSYPTWLARLLALGTLGLLVAFVRWLRRERTGDAALAPGALIVSSLVAVAAVVAALLASGLVHLGLRLAVDHFVLFARPLVAVVAGLLAGAGAFAATVSAALRRRDPRSLALGGLLVWGGALALVALVAPAASFVLQWPLLFGALGAWVWTWIGASATGARLARVDLALAGSLVPAAFFWGYTAYSLFVMMGAEVPEVVVLAAAAPLLLGLPVAARVGPLGLARAAKVLGAAGGALLLAGTVALRGTPDLPRPDTLAYTAETVMTAGKWTTTSPDHEAFVAQKIPAGKTMRTEAAFKLAPLVIDAHAVDEGDLRHGTLALTSPRQARCLRFWEVTHEPVVKVLVNDHLVGDVVRFSAELDEKLVRFWNGGRAPSAWVAEICGAGAATTKLELFWPRGKPLRLRILEISDGLPGPALSPRTEKDGYPDLESDTTSLMVDVKL